MLVFDGSGASAAGMRENVDHRPNLELSSVSSVSLLSSLPQLNSLESLRKLNTSP